MAGILNKKKTIIETIRVDFQTDLNQVEKL